MPEGGLLCVHAHPDDEAIATGGVLLRAAAQGRRTGVVTCTGGELGEIVGEGMDPAEVRPRLAAVRHGELAEALRLLGAGEPRLLGYRDSGMAGTAGNDDTRSFWRAPFDEAVARLVAQIRELRPEVVVTYDAIGLYGHPDHVQAHRVGIVAAEACAMPQLYPGAGPAWRVSKVYLATVPRSFTRFATSSLARLGLPSPFADPAGTGEAVVGVPDGWVDATVDVHDHLAGKLAALRAHASQVGPSSFFLNLPEDLHGAAYGTEWFLRHRSDVAVPGHEDDLFAGLPA